MIKLPAQFAKRQLPALKTHWGKIVRGGDADGKVFVTFAGSLQPDGLYHGELLFREPAANDVETVDFSTLINPPIPGAAERQDQS